MISKLARLVFRFAVAACLVAAGSQPAAAAAAASHVSAPVGALAGLHQTGPAPGDTLLHLAIELQPRADMDALAVAMSDPTAPVHRTPLNVSAFLARFARLDDARNAAKLLRSIGATDVDVAGDGLVIGSNLRIDQAQRFFGTHWMVFSDGTRHVIAPAGALTVPIAGVRDVRGLVLATTPHLSDTRPAFTLFRGDWYEPARFRKMTDAIPNGGTGQRIVVVEDASDRFELTDVRKFLAADGAPSGADIARVSERTFVFKSNASQCGRDDRGQEPALDLDSALTMAPLAEVVVDYDDVCSDGDDGTMALARALSLDPTALVYPFVNGPVDTTIAARYGLTPLPLLEAAVRGIPLVAPAGDDGAYGYREPGVERARVGWPCASPFVICAGGTQLGDRDGVIDEAPWNDLEHATGGGISGEPRPLWQNAAGDYLFSPAYVKTRIVPDVSADAAGHLRVYWHGYGLGGVGGTSESSALIAGELAAINSAIPTEHRLQSPGDLYVLANHAPGAFRDVVRENDRGWKDNTLRPPAPQVAKTYSGPRPQPPARVKACADLQPDGCTVTRGFDAVTGIGSLLEAAAVAALR